MRILHRADDLGTSLGGVCLALGMFDGVHRGHQHVVGQAVADAHRLGATPVAVTFHPHPLAILRPDDAPRLLQSLPHRLRELARLAPAATLVLGFTPALSRRTGREFIADLQTGFGRIRSVTVGAGFHFGHGRSGHVDLLREVGALDGFEVHAMEPVRVDGEVVSSTRIRTTLRSGDLAAVGRLLGRPYALAGAVVPGDRIGRTLGFPTANLDVAGLELPPHGVYAVRARMDGVPHPAALNLGRRPTVGDRLEERCEVHLIDFDGDLYGRELEVEFVRRLRGETRFASVGALREQIAADIGEARAVLATAGEGPTAG